MRAALLLVLVISAGWQTAVESPRVRITFEAMEPEFETAAAEYRALWAAEGARIIAALEKRSGLKWTEREIRAQVYEGTSASGFGTRPMRLGASYPAATKKATLIHEIGHRLHGSLFKREEEDHPFLFLYLYDVWRDLYGQAFADEQVRVESARKGLYDYERAWKQVLDLTEDERVTAWRNFVAARTARDGN